MPIRHPFAQAAALVIASLLIAVVANGFAGRTRQLKLPGWYPHALRVPPKEQPAPTPIAAAPVPTTTIAPTTTVVPLPTEQPSNPATQEPIQTQQPVPTQQPSNPATQQPKPPAPKTADLARFTPHPDKASVDITGDDAAALHTAGVLFLDARRSSIFEEGHIAGARSFSVWESDIDDKVNALFEERADPAEQNKPIVIYCSGGACEDSHMLAQKLWGIQFNNVYVYKDGFPDWQQRRLPVRTGANP
jgi:rhodanese-related sulfurtransferase